MCPLPGILGSNHADIDPEIWRKTPALAWKVSRTTGNVTYKLAGQDIFTDQGRRLVLTSSGSNEARAVLLALEMAKQKYGQQLTLTGSDEFKRSVVAIAVQNRLEVSFSDPALNSLKAELAQPAITQKSPAITKMQEPKAPSTLQAQQELKDLRAHYEANNYKLLSTNAKTGTRIHTGLEYRGEIIHITKHHVIQKTGANVLVAHQRSKLPQATTGKASVRIAYGMNGRTHIASSEVMCSLQSVPEEI